MALNALKSSIKVVNISTDVLYSLGNGGLMIQTMGFTLVLDQSIVDHSDMGHIKWFIVKRQQLWTVVGRTIMDQSGVN